MNPIVAIIITNIIWGAGSPIFKFAISNIPPFTLAFIGNMFLFIAMLGSVFNTIFGEKVMKTMDAIQVTCLTFLIGSLPFIPFMMKELQTWLFNQLNIHGWTGIVFGVFFSSAFAYYLYFYAMEKIEAQEVGLLMYIDPVAAVLIAMPLVSEYPNIYFFLGSFLVFGGIFLAEGRIHWHPLHTLKIKME